MANLQVDDLPLIPAVDNADVYGAKSNIDYRIRTGEANGLATLDGAGKVPVGQLPTLNFLPLSAGSGFPLTGNLYIGKDIPSLIMNDTTNGVNLKRGGMNIQDTTGDIRLFVTQDTDAGPVQFAWNFIRSDGSLTSTGNITTAGRVRALNHFNATTALAILSAEVGPVLLRPNGADNPANQTTIATNGNLTSGGSVSAVQNFVSSTTAVAIGPTGLGTVALRARGVADPLNQALLEANGAFTVAGVLGAFAGTVGAQEINFRMGWGNGVARWQTVMESNADWSLYTYDAAGIFVGQRLSIGHLSGVVTAVNFTATSDKNLKKEITDRVARSRLSDMLRFVEYIWKDSGQKGLGLIAQEVQMVAPEYVHEGRDGILSIDKAGIALECVIGLAARVAELEEKLG